MVSLLYCEFLKLKRSKIFIISILGAMVAPLMVFAGLIKEKIKNQNIVITYMDLFDQTNFYVLMILGIIVYGLIAAYLFSREYTENTLKSILTIPVSKSLFITTKFLMFFIWMMILTLVGWLSTLFLGTIGGVSGFHIDMLIKSLEEYIIGGTLLYLTLSPFVFLTIYFKNLMPPVIAIASVALGNIVLSNEDFATLYPWASPYIIASGKIDKYAYSIEIALLIIFLVFLIGVAISFIYFKKQDVK